MTNLEFHKDELKDIVRNVAKEKNFSFKCEAVGKAFEYFLTKMYDKDNDVFGYGCYGEEAIDWLLDEHKEPIKLKRWEFELIGYIYRTSSVKKMFFVHYSELNYLRGVGYFKGITNEYMTLKEILENCEVIDK